MTHLPQKCNVCASDLGESLITLPNLPLTELFFPELTSIQPYLFDQSLYHCENCSHTQLGNILPPATLYGSSYFFSTSGSETGKKVNDVFLDFIKQIITQSEYSNIIEIGCNDLYLLNQLREYGDNLVGIDPSLSDNIPNSPVSDSIIKIDKLVEDVRFQDYVDCSRPTLIISSHTLEHLTNPVDLFRTIKHQFNEEGLFIFQFPIMEFILENLRFDQIFHQHVNYFSKKSISYLIESLGGTIIAESTNPHHWGTYMVAFSFSKSYLKRGIDNTSKNNISTSTILEHYSEFCMQMRCLNRLLNQLVPSYPLIAYGAALMVPLLSYHLQFNFSRCAKIIDDDPRKQGMYYPGITTPISISNKKEGYQDSCILISAVDNTRTILIKAIELNPYKIIIPFQQIL